MNNSTVAFWVSVVASTCLVSFPLEAAPKAGPGSSNRPAPSPAPAPGAAERIKAPDAMFARTWAANAAGLLGKSVETCVQEVGEIGGVTSNSPFAVVPLTTGNARGESGGEILALVPLPRMQNFVEKALAAIGKWTVFGERNNPTVTSGTLANVEGELVLVVDGASTDTRGRKPSAILAEQRARK